MYEIILLAFSNNIVSLSVIFKDTFDIACIGPTPKLYMYKIINVGQNMKRNIN